MCDVCWDFFFSFCQSSYIVWKLHTWQLEYHKMTRISTKNWMEYQFVHLSKRTIVFKIELFPCNLNFCYWLSSTSCGRYESKIHFSQHLLVQKGKTDQFSAQKVQCRMDPHYLHSPKSIIKTQIFSFFVRSYIAIHLFLFYLWILENIFGWILIQNFTLYNVT